MISYEKGDIKFNFRVAAIIYNQNRTKILLLQTPGCEFCALPGGRVEELETSENGIIRELKEEMNINAKVKLTKIVENFFLLKEKKYHELSYYFVVTDIDDKSIYSHESFAGTEKKDYFKWVSLDDLEGIDFRPKSMKNIIINKDDSLECLVFNELI